jgi:ABC-type branched-subunit amino acid transport system substrate-binding protein
LSGEVASLGENAKNGAMLAYDNLEQGDRAGIQLLMEDDAFDPTKSVSAFNKLVSVDKVNLVICFTSSPCSALAPLADELDIPLIAIASAPVQKDKENVVRLEISTAEEGKKIGEFLNDKKYEKVASVVAVHDGIQAAYRSLKLTLGFSGKEVTTEQVAPDTKDFRTPIAKILAQKPQVIVVGLLPGMAGEFARQAKALGYTGDFVGFNFIEGEETLTSAQGALDGVVYTQAADPELWFASKYTEVYKKAPGPGSAHTYDAVLMVSQASGRARASTEATMKYLASVQDFEGALGAYGSIEGNEFALPLMFKTIKDNQFVKYE